MDTLREALVCGPQAVRWLTTDTIQTPVSEKALERLATHCKALEDLMGSADGSMRNVSVRLRSVRVLIPLFDGRLEEMKRNLESDRQPMARHRPTQATGRDP